MSTLPSSHPLYAGQKQEIEQEKKEHQPKIASTAATPSSAHTTTADDSQAQPQRHGELGGEYLPKRDMELPVKATITDEEEKAIAPDICVTHEATHRSRGSGADATAAGVKEGSDISHASHPTRSISHDDALRVFDVSDAPLLGIGGTEVAEYTVGWLRQQIAEKLAKERGAGAGITHAVGGGKTSGDIHAADVKCIFIYQHYGDWLADDVPLLKLEGDRVMFLRYFPHGDEIYNLYLIMIPSGHVGRVLTVPVTDNSTIHLIKTKVAAEHKIAIAHQRILFAGRLLEDQRTVESYKFPPEATLELDLISF